MYVGKYVSKNMGERKIEDKRAKTVRFLWYKPGERRCSCAFAWLSYGSSLGRAQLARVADRCKLATMEDFAKKLGKRWAYFLRESIGTTPVFSQWPRAAAPAAP